MANKNFIVKNGLTVGGVDIVSNSGVLTQSLITTVPSGAAATTQSVGHSGTALATTAYVRGEIDALIDSAPGTLNTLDELAAAINDDAQFNTTLTDAVALKAPIASPTFTGNVGFPNDTIDLAHMSDNSVDSDQYVDGSIDAAHLASGSVTSAKLDTNIAVSGTLGVASTIRVTTDGSASSPCYQVGGDADTGMYQPTTNQLGFTVAGTQKLYFTTVAMNLDSSLTSGMGLGDNMPVKWGNSGDLQIKHDGSDSTIIDSGTGNLLIGSNSFYLRNAANNETMLRADENSFVKLYYDNAEKLATTSTGVSITGNLIVSGTVAAENVDVTYSADWLIVAGGGGGGSRFGGGGGAGGMETGSSITLTSNTVYTATVGAGGAGGGASGGSYTGGAHNGSQGGTSSLSGTGISTVSVSGGGYGGAGDSQDGGAGGSGGGGAGRFATSGGAGTSGEGTAGGDGSGTNMGGDVYRGAGGGGKGAAGNDSTNTDNAANGAGGNGSASSITGSSVTYAGGGGGAGGSSDQTNQSSGGTGGGGAGNCADLNGVAGTANTGGGGGGGGYGVQTGGTNNPGLAGGTGIVILKVPTASYSGTTSGSPTVTTSGDYKIIKFTGSGTYTG
jgi:hypothetical protein